MDTCPPPPLPKNSIYIELAGNAAFFGSLNYERRLFNKKSFNLMGRAGFGFGQMMDRRLFTIPIIITNVFRVFRSISYEIGAGITLMRIGNNQNARPPFGRVFKNDIGFSALIGIRVQSKNGFLFRLNFTPVYYYIDLTASRRQFYPFFGISFGYSFGTKKKLNAVNTPSAEPGLPY